MDKRKKMLVFLATGALAVAAVFGMFSYRSAYAQATTPTPTTPDNQTAPGQPFQGGKGMRGGPRGGGGFTDQDLATALGITTDQLQTAYQTANNEALQEAVSQGLITQEQADQLSANGLGRRYFGRATGIDYNALLADALGITTDELQAAYTEALNTNLDNAVANGTLTQAQADLIKARSALANNAAFNSSMQTAFEAAVRQAVTNGVITQAQADVILAGQAQRGGFGGGFFGHGFGRGHGRGGPGFNGVPGTTPANPSPTTTPSTNGI